MATSIRRFKRALKGGRTQTLRLAKFYQLPFWREYVDRVIAGGQPRLFVFLTPWLVEAHKQGIVRGYTLYKRELKGRKVVQLTHPDDIYAYADLCCEISSIKNWPVEVALIDRFQAGFRAKDEPPIKLDRMLVAAGGNFLGLPSEIEWKSRFELSRKKRP